jgi:hypothetical protein
MTVPALPGRDESYPIAVTKFFTNDRKMCEKYWQNRDLGYNYRNFPDFHPEMGLIFAVLSAVCPSVHGASRHQSV